MSARLMPPIVSRSRPGAEERSRARRAYSNYVPISVTYTNRRRKKYRSITGGDPPTMVGGRPYVMVNDTFFGGRSV